MVQANVAAALDGVTVERVHIESVTAASVVVSFYIGEATGAGTSSSDAVLQFMAMDAATLQSTFSGFERLEQAPVRRM